MSRSDKQAARLHARLMNDAELQTRAVYEMGVWSDGKGDLVLWGIYNNEWLRRHGMHAPSQIPKSKFKIPDAK